MFTRIFRWCTCTLQGMCMCWGCWGLGLHAVCRRLMQLQGLHSGKCCHGELGYQAQRDPAHSPHGQCSWLCRWCKRWCTDVCGSVCAQVQNIAESFKSLQAVAPMLKRSGYLKLCFLLPPCSSDTAADRVRRPQRSCPLGPVLQRQSPQRATVTMSKYNMSAIFIHVWQGKEGGAYQVFVPQRGVKEGKVSDK